MRRLPALLLLAACARPSAPAREQPAAAPTAPAPTAPAPAEPPAFDRVPAPAMSWLGADWLTRPERLAEEDPEAMLDLLRLTPGMRVADIGAGVGFHSVRIAARVGPSGQVYATDLQPEMLARLQDEVAARGLTNVAAVRSTDLATGLPDASVDLALLVDVYHELQQPAAFMRDLARALRPGGRVALVEFRGEDPDVPIRPEHKMTAAAATAEMKAIGYAPAERHDALPWQHVLVYTWTGPGGPVRSATQSR